MGVCVNPRAQHYNANASSLMHILIERVGDCLTAAIDFRQSDRLKTKTRECEFKLIPSVAFLTSQDEQFRCRGRTF
jgi:hypothetical protein